MNSRNILTKFVSFFLVLSLSVVSFAETVEKFEEPNFEYTEEEKAILADAAADKAAPASAAVPAPTGYSFLIGSAVLTASVGLVVYVLRRGADAAAPIAGMDLRRNPVRAARFQNTYGE